MSLLRCTGAMLVLTSVLLAACAQHVNAPSENAPLAKLRFRSERIDSIAPPDWPQKLPAYVQTPITLGPFPVVVLIGPGRWNDGDARDMRFVGEYLAERGFAAVSISHRPARDARFPAQLEDLREAFRWINANAREYRFDVERLSLMGFESGGHLAALFALNQTRTWGIPGLPRDAALPPVRGVVAGGAPLDLAPLAESEDVQRLLGGTPAQIPEVYERASPLKHVHAEAPPFFLFHGTTDGAVPIEQADAMLAALEQAGVTAELYRMKLRGRITTYFTVTGALSAATDFLWREVAEPGRYGVGLPEEQQPDVPPPDARAVEVPLDSEAD